MAIKWSNLPSAEFWGFFRTLLHQIEQYAGEEQNPDHMLAEGQALNAEKESLFTELNHCFFAKNETKYEEHAAFKVLLDCIKPLKKLAYVLDGDEGLRKLAIPSRMPVGRDDTRRVARAMLSAWDEHSADPVFSSLNFLFDRLKTAYDDHLAAWNAKEDAYCTYHDKVRSYRALRKRANKYVGNVKRYIGVYWDAFEGSWVKYGFEPRKRPGEAKEPEANEV